KLPFKLPSYLAKDELADAEQAGAEPELIEDAPDDVGRQSQILPMYISQLVQILNDPKPLPTSGSEYWDFVYWAIKVASSRREFKRDNGPLSLNKLGDTTYQRLEELKRSVDDCPPETQPHQIGQQNPYHNLREYVRRTILPILSWSTSAQIATGSTTSTDKTRPKSSATHREPNNDRLLRRVCKIPQERFLQEVKQYTLDGQATRAQADSEHEHPEGGSLMLRTYPWNFDVPKSANKLAIENETQLQGKIADFVLETVMRILHVCDSDTAQWNFIQPNGKNAHGTQVDFAWVNEEGPEVQSRLILEVKTPWNLTERSAIEFSELATVG
ncbi:hypothetical protein FRB99_004310, partial [Tulasnella sp. 403]